MAASVLVDAGFVISPMRSTFSERGAVVPAFDLADELERVLGLADACLVRMSEPLAGPVILTTDADFRI